MALKSRKEAAPSTEREPLSEIDDCFNRFGRSHREPRLPCSRRHSKLRIPAQSSSYKLIELPGRVSRSRTRTDAQHLVLTENDKSDEQERSFDQREAGGLGETLLSGPTGHSLQRRATRSTGSAGHRGEVGGKE